MSYPPEASAGPQTTATAPVVVLLIAPEPSGKHGRWTLTLGLVTFVSGAFLIVMFAALSQGGSAAPWGPINDLLGAAGNVILAGLVPWLSRGAARTPAGRALVKAVVVACLAAAASGVLLVAGVLPFEPSTAVSMVTIVLQCAWMIWLNRAWLREGRMPRRIGRFGLSFGVGLLAGIALVGGSMLLPWGSPAANALLFPGVALGAAMWILWPLWFIMLGRWLSRAPGTEDPTLDAAASASRKEA